MLCIENAESIVPDRSLSPDSTLAYQIAFRQNFNTYSWQLNFNYSKLYKNIEIQVNKAFLSSMIKIGHAQPKCNDDDKTRLEMNYHLTPSWSFYSALSKYSFSDRQSGLANDISTTSASVGIRLHHRHLFVQPSAGWKSDTRYQQKDEGLTYSLMALIHDQEVNEYHNSLDVLVDGDRIGTRANQNSTFSYQIYKEFQEQTADTIAIISTHKRRDNYISSASEIESFIEQMNSINHSLEYHISDDFFFNLHNKLSRRSVEVAHRVAQSDNLIFAQPFTPSLQAASAQQEEESRKRTDFRSEHDAALLIKTISLESRIGARYWSQEQSYDIPGAAKNLPFSFRTSFVAQDNQSFELTAYGTLGWQFLRSDSLGIDASMSRLQYDTPDTSNFDDRDEFKLKLNLIEVHAFSPYLRLRLEANVSLYHFVYIFSERSADNNWTRIFRLAPDVQYSPFSNFKLTQQFEVLAKYVDFDYEFENRDISSFVYRQFASESSCQYRLLPATWLHLHYRIEMEENGKLYWDRWAERPLLLRNNSWFRASLRYKPNPYFEVSPGVYFYARTEWRYQVARTGAPEKEKSSELQSIGPTLSIAYQPNSKLQFSCIANQQRISGSNQKHYTVSSIDIFLNWYF
ncbi:hypothetical protein JXJ21_00245 [candidate division KSB1 bacterium]|nr:hypothetical protein [candidate division KSB1 bacterium]